MKKNKIEEVLVENSISMDTLKPDSMSAGPDPKSKIEYITQAIGAMHAMKKDDLTKWFHDAMDLIGKETRELPAHANDAGNKTSLRAKPSYAVGNADAAPNDMQPSPLKFNTPGQTMREDVEEMFIGQDLSEEFKEKVSTLFEAAVNLRALTEVARIEEEYETALEEAVTEIEESLQIKLDTYLDYVVENWMIENEVAIESSLRNEITEEFIDGLKNLFAEHYIDVPDDKVDVVESLASKVEELESKLDDLITENVDLKRVVVGSKKTDLIESFAEDLTLMQSEKFFALAEGLEFDGDLNRFFKKLSVVKENYFTNKKASYSNIEEETFEQENTTKLLSNDPEVNRYAEAISRSVKK